MAFNGFSLPNRPCSAYIRGLRLSDLDPSGTPYFQKAPAASGREQTLKRKAHMKLNQIVFNVCFAKAKKAWPRLFEGQSPIYF